MVDSCIRVLLSDGFTRVSAVLMTSSVREAQRRHATSAIASVALGRAMVTGGLLGSTVREDGRVNLQFVGNGPLGAILVDVGGAGTVRAYARCPLVTFPMPGGRVAVSRAVGREGFLNVLLDPSGGKFSRATTELLTGEIDDDVGGYLEQSAQVRSAIGADVLLGETGEAALAAGLLVQLLPGGSPRLVDAAHEVLRNGGIHALLRDDPPASPHALIHRLFPHERTTFLDERPLRWQCTCSRDRVMGAIACLGTEEVGKILHEDGKVDATCDFCSAAYVLSRDDLTALLAEMHAHSHGGPEVA